MGWRSEIDDKQPYFRGYNGYNLSNVDNNSFRMGDNSSELGNDLSKMRGTVSNGLDRWGGGGGENSNKRCFRRKPKLFRESGDFSGNRDT